LPCGGFAAARIRAPRTVRSRLSPFSARGWFCAQRAQNAKPRSALSFFADFAPFLSKPKPQYIVIRIKYDRKILWFLGKIALPTELAFLRAAFDKRADSAPLSPRKIACYNLYITKRFRLRGIQNV